MNDLTRRRLMSTSQDSMAKQSNADRGGASTSR